MAKGADPWSKGPAIVLPFPDRWQRAWIVSPLGDGTFQAEMRGDDFTGPRITEAGQYSLVMQAVCQRHVRRGLPIVAGDEWGEPL